MASDPVSLKILERRGDEELFYEEFRVEDGDVSGAADESIRVGGQRMVHVVPHKCRVVMVAFVTCPMHEGAQNVGHHLAVGASCGRRIQG